MASEQILDAFFSDLVSDLRVQAQELAEDAHLIEAA